MFKFFKFSIYAAIITMFLLGAIILIDVFVNNNDFFLLF